MTKFDDPSWGSARLEETDPVVPLGDLWAEHNTGYTKRGTGGKKWSELPYWHPHPPTALDASDFGAKGDGATDDTAAIQRAIAKVPVGGTLWFPPGTYKTTAPLEFGRFNVIMPRTTYIQYTGTGTAVTITDPANCDIQMGVRRTSRLWDSTDSTSKGVLIIASGQYVTHSRFTLDIREFNIGLELRGDANGISYSDFDLEVLDNKTGVRIDIVSAGWVNQNVFQGRTAYFSGAASYAGTTMLEMVEGGNGNEFIDFGFEGSSHEKSIVVAGNYNQFKNCRWESNPAGAIELQAASNFNRIDGGFGLLGPSSTIVSDSGTYNQIFGTAGARMSFATAHDPLGLHLRGQTGSPTVLSAGISDNMVRGEIEATGIFKSYDAAGKGSGGAPYAAVEMDGNSTTRGIRFRNWVTGTSPGRIYTVNDSFIGIQGHILAQTDNTYDFGINTNRFRDGWFGRKVQIGGELDHDGTTAGFFNVTPATRPTAYTQTYATADKTHADFTSSDLTGITSSTTGSALAEPSAAYTQAEMQQNFRRIQDQFVALRADVADLKQLVNSVIDDFQTLGLLQ